MEVEEVERELNENSEMGCEIGADDDDVPCGHDLRTII